MKRPAARQQLTRSGAGGSGGVEPVTVELAGKQYRLRSDASEAWLQQVAAYVDRSMQQIRQRTDTVDSLDIALLTALNLAREVLQRREQDRASDAAQAGREDGAGELRLRDLIEQVEAELPSAAAGD